MGLVEKLKNMKAETKKRIIAAALAGGVLVATGIGLANYVNENNPNSGGTITNSGSSASDGSSASNNNESNKYSKYSKVLQKVFTDDYYNHLIWEDEKLIGFGSSHGQNKSYKSNSYKAIPYGFLESEGYDLNLYHQDILGAEATAFSIGNNLYVECKVENQASENYYTHYILKYSITDQEKYELWQLFQRVYKKSHRTTYLQGPFFIQELSYQKTPEVLSKTYMTTDAMEGMEGKYCGLDASFGGYLQMAAEELGGSKKHHLHYSFISCTSTSDTYSNCDTVFLVHLDPVYYGTCGSFKVSILTCKTSGSTTYIDGKEVFSGSEYNDYTSIKADDYKEFLKNITDAICYDSRKAYLENFLNDPKVYQDGIDYYLDWEHPHYVINY